MAGHSRWTNADKARALANEAVAKAEGLRDAADQAEREALEHDGPRPEVQQASSEPAE